MHRKSQDDKPQAVSGRFTFCHRLRCWTSTCEWTENYNIIWHESLSRYELWCTRNQNIADVFIFIDDLVMSSDAGVECVPVLPHSHIRTSIERRQRIRQHTAHPLHTISQRLINVKSSCDYLVLDWTGKRFTWWWRLWLWAE